MKKSKFGIVVLIDALGVRNMTIDMSHRYLKTVGKLRDEIHDALKVTLEVDKEKQKDTEDLFKKLRPRFFADSLLMTYEVVRERRINRYLSGLSFILNILIVQALEEGILYRGAFSIGKYIENEDIVLGPAITDVASWYDKLNMVGVMATPAASLYMKAARNTSMTDLEELKDPNEEFVMYPVPLKGGKVLNTHTLNWPGTIQDVHGHIQKTDPLLWYYQRVKGMSLPVGTEDKYENTERFLIDIVAKRKRFDIEN